MTPRLRHADVESTVERSCACGHPRVLRCRPIRMQKDGPVPFPTLFWLACPEQNRRVSRLEHAGLIAEIEQLIAADPELCARVHSDHRAYRHERWTALTPDEQRLVTDAGLHASYDTGIGGTRNFDAVKCLHLHFAHHLARGSAIGEIIEQHLPLPDPCPPAQPGPFREA